jgi:hypothetical protein
MSLPPTITRWLLSTQPLWTLLVCSEVIPSSSGESKRCYQKSAVLPTLTKRVLFRGMQIRGKKRKDTVLICLSSDEVDEGKISMNKGWSDRIDHFDGEQQSTNRPLFYRFFVLSFRQSHGTTFVSSSVIFAMFMLVMTSSTARGFTFYHLMIRLRVSVLAFGIGLDMLPLSAGELIIPCFESCD